MKNVVPQLKRFLYTLLTTIFFLLCSCADKYERNIDKHFKNYIFTKEFKMVNYEIESIERKKGDTLTKVGKEIRSVNHTISSMKNNILNANYAKSEISSELSELISGEKFYRGSVFYYATRTPQSYVYDGYAVYDYDNLGRDNLILERKSRLKSLDSVINELSRKIKKEQLNIQTLTRHPDNKILEISSTVRVKGMHASGIKRLQFNVVQYSNGEIKSVKPH